MSDVPQAKPECEHYWAFHCYGGLSVRLCKLCHEPDWDELRAQLAEAQREGGLAEREWIAHLAATEAVKMRASNFAEHEAICAAALEDFADLIRKQS